MKRKIIRAILRLVRYLIEVLCGTSMVGIPALIVHNGGNMTVPGLLLIWIPLAIPLAVCAAIDTYEEKKAEQRRFAAMLRRYEKERLRKHEERRI